MFHAARAAGGNQRYVAHVAHFFQLLQIVAVAYTVLVHHVQDDFARAAFLHFLHPVQRFPLRDAGTAFIPGILVNMIFAGFGVIPGINAYHDTLHAEAVRQAGDKLRFGQRRGVDRDFIRPEGEDARRIVDGFNTTGNAERNIDHFRHARYPAFIHYAAIAGGGDIVEHQFICAFIGIAFCQRDNVANNLVIAKLDAFYHLSITNVQTRNYAFCQH